MNINIPKSGFIFYQQFPVFKFSACQLSIYFVFEVWFKIFLKWHRFLSFCFFLFQLIFPDIWLLLNWFVRKKILQIVQNKVSTLFYPLFYQWFKHKLKPCYMLILCYKEKEGQLESPAQTNTRRQCRCFPKKIQCRERISMCKYSLYCSEEETSGKYL